MKKPPRLLILASCLSTVLIAGGCVKASFVPTGAGYPSRGRYCEIEVFSSAVPDREYEEIGIAVAASRGLLHGNRITSVQGENQYSGQGAHLTMLPALMHPERASQP